jgi:hypothetical protein
VIVVQLVFNSVLGEDLLFRGILLPRMRGVFGRGDFVANGVLFCVLPPSHPVVDPRRPGGHHPHRLSHAAVAERVDEHHRPLGSERLRHLRHPPPRAWLIFAAT